MFAFCSSLHVPRYGSGRSVPIVALLVLSLNGVTAGAQSPASLPPVPETSDTLDAPAHIGVADGRVTLERENETIAAAAGEPLVPGDRLRTDDGRADIWFADGSTLAIDARSAVEVQSESLFHLTEGRLLLVVSRAGLDDRSSRLDYRIDTPLGSVAIDGPGEYSVSLTNDYIALSIVRGSAELVADAGSMIVRAGERTFARADGAPATPQRFNSARQDAFDRWAASAHDGRRGRSNSASYLPANLQTYAGVLDRSGSWEYDSGYGYVWYPVVDSGWRPYFNGYWRPLPRYGWTWVGGDRWGWPTHHYGRWGYARSRWFWIPQRRWAPAWVSWASAADYLSWCPLGFDNRPVFSFSLSVGNTWAGWVVLPRRSFGVGGAFVSRYAYDGRRLPRNLPFALHAQAPITPPAFRARYGQPRIASVYADRGRPERRLEGRDRERFDGNRTGDVRGRNGQSPGRAAARGQDPRDGARGGSRADVRNRRGAGAEVAGRTEEGRDGWTAPWPSVAVPRGSSRTDDGDRSYRRGNRDRGPGAGPSSAPMAPRTAPPERVELPPPAAGGVIRPSEGRNEPSRPPDGDFTRRRGAQPRPENPQNRPETSAAPARGDYAIRRSEPRGDSGRGRAEGGDARSRRDEGRPSGPRGEEGSRRRGAR